MTRPFAEPGFGIYIHWPFCAQKCPYCDFNSHVRHQGWDEARFLAAYKRELDAIAEMTSSVPDVSLLTSQARRNAGGDDLIVSSIFFGGGTPSLMNPTTTAAIIDHIAKLWPVSADAEVTLEANPGSVEAARFKGYKLAGINRVSIGLQSLRDDDLKKLGRVHSAGEAKAALAIARETFERFSFDLIYARPGQSPNGWRAELREALEMAGDHISLYQLTIEPDTPYAALAAAGKLVVPDADAALALYDITQDMTEARGYRAYEISNHARPGDESRHNLLYWNYGAYAGVGPGAHGRLLAHGKRVATVAEKNPEAWCARVERNGHGFTEIVELTPAEQADEALLMGLRLSSGINLEQLQNLGGRVPSQKTLDGLAQLGLIEFCDTGAETARGWTSGNEPDLIMACAGPGLAPAVQTPEPKVIRATPRGRYVLNALVAEISKSFEAVRA